ncbi:NAD-glutamate dehydrogenase [Parasphingopyxis algicola]|uniref:NAD-glutamate dehydrogenase n=1 Tax=Parasphingopyxis algicola TaxID=2026624 RepID=UPI0015A1C9A5|nr:NAD-glutamate dehydrogenase domain-containing protein [Parasphingopyxis algicola]QLC26005.1 NAD-glutamate dehydrogenase [Parasphingopyxis algicola]
MNQVPHNSQSEQTEAHIAAIADALVHGALPGETDNFSDAEALEAARFVAAAAAERLPGMAEVRLESITDDKGRRFMRMAIVNDDMPFIVDSITGAVGAHGLTVLRLLHPIVSVARDEHHHIVKLGAEGDTANRESFVYLEIDRADARTRLELLGDVHQVLLDVRAAVRDWPALQERMRTDAEKIADREGKALLEWFVDHHFTQVGHYVEDRQGNRETGLGIFRAPGPSCWNQRTREAAFSYFENGGSAPLLSKADRIATVHRRVPLDLAIVPIRENGELARLSVHAGLWTSVALNAPADEVPVLRGRLEALEKDLGFDPNSHAGKALEHALSRLPHDILIAFDGESMKQAALTAMSLADRPRPKLLLIKGPMQRHLFAFVWMPRDEMSTTRRTTIGARLEEATGSMISSWSIELGDGDLAFIRYTLDIGENAEDPDAEALDAEIEQMVRGWSPAVEAELGERLPSARAARLTLTYANAFPNGYRSEYGAEEAAKDILRLRGLTEYQRGVRLYRLEGDTGSQLRLKLYRLGASIPLSDTVPVLENFGFRVLEEIPTPLDGGRLGYIHDFLLEIDDVPDLDGLIERAGIKEGALSAVLEGRAENDEFNQLIVSVGLNPRDVTLLRAWFRYLRQTGLSYGLATVVETLRDEPDITRAIVELFDTLHNPDFEGDRDSEVHAINSRTDGALTKVAAIDDDTILRAIRAVVNACLRTNAFSPAANEALAFKLDSSAIPGLPAPVPWREIWVYSPRVEGIHLRGGPIARGGLRWSDRRDDFRTEILGLMKAQLVKNAVIVPTGAKGGFFPKALPNPAEDRDAWIAEGTESYRIFIRTLLSVTDNLVENDVVHPDRVVIRDGEDPYFVVAADKGTASFSDVANAIALERKFWLGDAFASGGGHGYDHKAMGITAKGAWISVQRHFLEMGIDVQTDPIRVGGCGDMSGDVFGNGMLLSKAIKLVAAFDHRHIFLDPDPDPAASWDERNRLFELPRSSWEDYDEKLISKGGGVFSRSQKEIPLSPEVREMLGVSEEVMRPSQIISAILKAEIDLIWFGGIGTYIKASSEAHIEVGDPANDKLRVNGKNVRAKAVGEGANLGLTQAGRIEFAMHGGRINTDFIDNSAGVDCSDNEVNIKIPLNREMAEGRLEFDDRNALLVSMTDEVADLVLEDNRLQTLALSLAEHDGHDALPSQVRVIEILESNGRIDREVEGLANNEELLRRGQENRGLTRPELSVLLAHSKLNLQDAVEATDLPEDPTLEPLLHHAFPTAMRERFPGAIANHRLKRQIVATKIANRVINRIGIIAPFELAVEEGVGLAQVAIAYFAADTLFDLETLWEAIETAEISEADRFRLFDSARMSLRLHLSDIIRNSDPTTMPNAIAELLAPGIERLDAAADDLLKEEARHQSDAMRERLGDIDVDPALVARIVRLYELDGAVGTSALAARLGVNELEVTRAYTRLGEALGLDWAKAAALRFGTSDPWERLLAAGLSRDFEQLRLDFLARNRSGDPVSDVESWLTSQRPRVRQFSELIGRARTAPTPSAAMLAQIGAQARILLGREG